MIPASLTSGATSTLLSRNRQDVDIERCWIASVERYRDSSTFAGPARDADDLRRLVAGTFFSGDGDGDLAAYDAVDELTHGIGHFVERIGSVDARHHLTCLNEGGEAFEGAAVLL